MGSWQEPAERKLYRFDPQPDLDNANVGKHGSLCGMPYGIPFFLPDTAYPKRSTGGTTLDRYTKVVRMSWHSKEGKHEDSINNRRK